jgi:hypothetical protein
MITRRNFITSATAIAVSAALPLPVLQSAVLHPEFEPVSYREWLRDYQQEWATAKQMQQDIREHLEAHSPLRRSFLRGDLADGVVPIFRIDGKHVACLERRGAAPSIIGRGEFACVPTFEICATPSASRKDFRETAEAFALEERANMERLAGVADGQGILFFRNDVTVLPCFDKKHDRAAYFVHEEIAMTQFINEGVKEVQFPHWLGQSGSPELIPSSHSNAAITLRRHGYEFMPPSPR